MNIKDWMIDAVTGLARTIQEPICCIGLGYGDEVCLPPLVGIGTHGNYRPEFTLHLPKKLLANRLKRRKQIQLLNEVCHELTKMDWEGIAAVTHPFIAFATDIFYRDWKFNLESSAPHVVIGHDDQLIELGATVLLERGSKGRIGKGQHRFVRGRLVSHAGGRVTVQLLEDDPFDTVGWRYEGQFGHWGASQIRKAGNVPSVGLLCSGAVKEVAGTGAADD